MASPEPTSATLTVEDIAVFTDAELAEFMKKHRRPNGGFELPVDGWDKLSKDERDQLAERLKQKLERQELGSQPGAREAHPRSNTVMEQNEGKVSRIKRSTYYQATTVTLKITRQVYGTVAQALFVYRHKTFCNDEERAQEQHSTGSGPA
ncbi:hypothetical protein N0V84_011732 [Fusarium piperis]|uniref:Uncharacterized protein n=1 Tax=Fusarium piperis TaxID=1435070 RepID=A0A9W8TAM4_9HYPO|nr:hypothetical protein N0V84_011732 [Fusarium piperis]